MRLLLTGYGLLPDSESDCLFNPFTEQIVETVGSRYDGIKYGISNLTFLGKPLPSSPQSCFVLAMSLISSQGISQLQPGNPATAGKAEWWTLVVGVFDQIIEFIPSCICPVLWRDCWYFLGHNGRLGRLRFTDLKKKKSVWKVETHKCPCQNYTRSYLSECGGELVSVFIADSDQESWIRVFKLGDNMWEEIDSLSTYNLYLGWPSSMGCHAQTPDMADRICFPRFYKGGLVYYSLKTKKYYSTGSSGRDEELISFLWTTMYANSAWIIPEIVS